MALYYGLFFFPPRLVGSNDPDRYYHLGLSHLIAQHGLLTSLPQVEDLGWARHFPEKEFLFHVLTAAADSLGGPGAVLLLVPLLGTAIVLVLYATLARVCRPWQAALFATLLPFAYIAFIYRLTILRPHLLAILFFVLLLHAILRRRAWLVAIACAGFALAYHAFYIVLLALALAYLLKWRVEGGAGRLLGFGVAGLTAGIVLNPYFPDNVAMSMTVIGIAMGFHPAPGAELGEELQAVNAGAFVSAFGFSFFALAVVACQRWFRRGTGRDGADLRFLFALTLALTLLSIKSVRAVEYALPSLVLLVGYFVARAGKAWWTPVLLAALAVLQATTAVRYYADTWTRPQGGNTDWYFSAISALPAAPGRKVFTCQWDAGAYLLLLRPDLRFVDILDPTLLWQVAPDKYLLRQQIIQGRVADAQAQLRDRFDADYVLCGSRPFNAQMLAEPSNFRELAHVEAMGPIRVFEVARRRAP